MNFFEQELRKVCSLSDYIERPKFVGRSCVFRLTDDITGKMEFVERGHADHFTAMKLSLFNRREGQIDCQIIDLTELLGRKTMGSGNQTNAYIWRNGTDVHWYCFRPTDHDYRAMAESADDYLSCFSNQEMTEDESMSIDLK